VHTQQKFGGRRASSALQTSEAYLRDETGRYTLLGSPGGLETYDGFLRAGVFCVTAAVSPRSMHSSPGKIVLVPQKSDEAIDREMGRLNRTARNIEGCNESLIPKFGVVQTRGTGASTLRHRNRELE
jgi:hypothetical protein